MGFHSISITELRGFLRAALATGLCCVTQTPGRIQNVEPPSSGIQYSYGADYGNLKVDLFLDFSRGLGTEERQSQETKAR